MHLGGRKRCWTPLKAAPLAFGSVLISSDLPSPQPVSRQLQDPVMDRFTVFSIALDLSFRTRERGGRRQPQPPLLESIKGEIFSQIRQKCRDPLHSDPTRNAVDGMKALHAIKGLTYVRMRVGGRFLLKASSISTWKTCVTSFSSRNFPGQKDDVVGFDNRSYKTFHLQVMDTEDEAASGYGPYRRDNVKL